MMSSMFSCGTSRDGIGIGVLLVVEGGCKGWEDLCKNVQGGRGMEGWSQERDQTGRFERSFQSVNSFLISCLGEV